MLIIAHLTPPPNLTPLPPPSSSTSFFHFLLLLLLPPPSLLPPAVGHLVVWTVVDIQHSVLKFLKHVHRLRKTSSHLALALPPVLFSYTVLLTGLTWSSLFVNALFFACLYWSTVIQKKTHWIDLWIGGMTGFASLIYLQVIFHARINENVEHLYEVGLGLERRRSKGGHGGGGGGGS